jgi:hypothetical protein
MREIWSDCYDEIEKIFKENVKENGEVRIDLADEDEREYGIIKMAFPDDNSFEHIASIVCKVEGANVDITLYTDEDVDFELYEIDDYDALAQVYDVIYDYFDNIY